jgi:hypothetical protein
MGTGWILNGVMGCKMIKVLTGLSQKEKLTERGEGFDKEDRAAS